MLNNISIEKSRIHFVSILIILSILSGCSSKTVVSIRPVTLRVVDKITKEPLKNIYIKYFVRKRKYSTTVLAAISHAPADWFVVAEEDAYTNQDGLVHFFNKKINLSHNKLTKKAEEIDEEIIMINLDLKQEHKSYTRLTSIIPSSEELIENPNGNYRGYYIFNMYATGSKPFYRDDQKKIGEFINWGGLSKDKEFILVELIPWSSL